MEERERYSLATTSAEAMYNIWELQYQQEEPNLNSMMHRLKDLSSYSLTHAEIMDQREGAELLALAMFFGATSDPGFHNNQERLKLLSEEAVEYQGRAENIEEEVANRRASKKSKPKNNNAILSQMQLL